MHRNRNSPVISQTFLSLERLQNVCNLFDSARCKTANVSAHRSSILRLIHILSFLFSRRTKGAAPENEFATIFATCRVGLQSVQHTDIYTCTCTAWRIDRTQTRRRWWARRKKVPLSTKSCCSPDWTAFTHTHTLLHMQFLIYIALASIPAEVSPMLYTRSY